jgi:hypothetical protein
MRGPRAASFVVFALWLATACGQSHGLDADSGVVSTSAECDALRRAHSDAFEAAVFCEPAEDTCTLEIHDSCGCVSAANDSRPTEAAEARRTWEALSAADCVPDTCGPCRAAGAEFVCEPLPVGTSGTCEAR